MSDSGPASGCAISVHVRHRLATVTVRDDLLVWVRSGVKTLINQHGGLDCKAGEAVLIARGSQWDVVNDPAPAGRYEALVLQFGGAAIGDFHARHAADFAAAALRGCAPLGVDAELERSLDGALDTLRSASASARLRHHRVLDVLLLLAERGHLFAPADALGWDERVRRLIGQRPQAPWRADTLARALHVSASTLRRRLLRSGTTIGDLVREVRLETALLLLQSTALPVGDVARRCGYDSHSRFSAAFRSRYGFAPSDLRGAPRTEPLNAPAQKLTRPG